MRQVLLLVLGMLLFSSCAEELIEKPDNLIPEDKMVSIIKEMAIVNAAKTTNLGKLRENGIEPTTFVFEKFEIDSAQFVDSDRYYASKPLRYENMYKKVESELEAQRVQLDMEKKLRDSISLAKKTKKKIELKEKDSIAAKTGQK
ncbi:DUF4296 domain-containing protein [Maribacter stanieri]|jgi:hypothetical protein|uniref:DUF4296 domain-containing protein n=1 Tax=Maribacter stanieri TaxID=440514 RepID=A0A1I6HGI6_9FLAO|nr:DUF4296 domain-containing protein [Maribacter stanieri]SFR53541.1 protein of unknown function [Maribacter stanieri]|tara:strand:+ start:2238 stop:2672 length:435 start_codon:yes stop_codon:yes gene_type:complete